jgi:hypothetical protein
MAHVVRRLCKVALLSVALAGCKSKSSRGELSPPDDAPAWEERYGVAFDDDYTSADLQLGGRASHDVFDQQLFAARLGYAAIIVLAKVEQVWGRGRYQGRRAQYLDVELGEVLLGELPKGTRKSQLIRLRGEDDVPADLQGRQLVFFVRWAPGADPAYHHHLMPAEPKIVEYIRALVKHAREEGALDGVGKGKSKRKARRRAKAGAKVDGDGDDSGDGAPPE